MKPLSLLIVSLFLLSCEPDQLNIENSLEPEYHRLDTTFSLAISNCSTCYWGELKFAHYSNKLIIPTKGVIFGELGILGIVNLETGEVSQVLNSNNRHPYEVPYKYPTPSILGQYVVFDTYFRFQCFDLNSNSHLWGTDKALCSYLNHGYNGGQFYNEKWYYYENCTMVNNKQMFTIQSTPVSNFDPETVYTQAELTDLDVGIYPNFQLSRNSAGHDILVITNWFFKSGRKTLVSIIDLTADQTLYTDTIFQEYSSNSPLLFEGDVVVVPSENRLTAYDILNGGKLWYRTSDIGSWNDKVFFTYDGEFFNASSSLDAWVGYDIQTGQVTRRLDDLSNLSVRDKQVSINDHILYYTTDGEIRAMDLRTGEHLISREESQRLGHYRGGVHYVPEYDLIIAHTRSDIHALHLDLE